MKLEPCDKCFDYGWLWAAIHKPNPQKVLPEHRNLWTVCGKCNLNARTHTFDDACRISELEEENSELKKLLEAFDAETA